MMNKPIDYEAARELALYIENDYTLYKQNIVPACNSLNRRIKNGSYDAEKALVMWERIATIGAKNYCTEFAGYEDLPRVFNVPTRKETAKELQEFFADHLINWND